MEWAITTDEGLCVVFAQCDQCNKPEGCKSVVEFEWVMITDNGRLTNMYCGEECAFKAEEQAKSHPKTIEEEANAGHGL